MRTALCAIALVICSLGFAEAKPKIELVDHTIGEGETCASIARKFWGDGKRYDVIHEFNPWLGPKLPHSLEVGKVLKLPPEIPPDAWITDRVREVRHRAARARKWKDSEKEQRLLTGYRVSTGEDSAAELLFVDDSVLRLRNDSLVVIYGRNAGQARRETSRAKLERGALRSRLAALGGQMMDPDAPEEEERLTRTLVVETSSAIATGTEGGEVLMSVDSEGLTCVSNHSGGAVEVASRVAPKKPVKVRKGMGTRVKRGKKPEKPRKLPPAPKWVAEEPVLAFGLQAEAALVQAAWKPSKGALRYRLQITRDEAGKDPLGASWMAGDVFRVRTRGYAAGTYWLHLAALEASGLESVWSKPREVQVKVPEGGQLEVVPGTRLGSEARCTLGEAPVEDGLAAGDLKCGERSLVVTAVPVSVKSKKTKLRRKKSTTLKLSLESASPLPDHLEAGGADLEVSSFQRTGDRSWTVKLEALAKGSKTLELRAAGVVLASLPLEVK